MKYCFQATATGSWFTLGKRERNEHQWRHRVIKWHESPWDIPSQVLSTTRVSAHAGATWWAKPRQGLGLTARGSPAREAEFQSSSAMKIFPLRVHKPRKPGVAAALAGINFVCPAHPFQERASKWTSCHWRLVMRQCTSAAANGQRIYFYPELFPWLSEHTPTWIPPAFSCFHFFDPINLIYIQSKTVEKMSLQSF